MAFDALEQEARRRTIVDGIPRHIVNGKIMKLDWELLDPDAQAVYDERLEEHIANLMAQTLENDD